MPSPARTSLALSTLAFVTLSPVLAHIGIWHPSVYGFNASGREPEHWFDEPVNTNFIKNPLRLDDNLSLDSWWFHGLRNATPDAVMELPVGETITIQTSCNKAFTTYGLVPEQLAMVGDLPCDINLKDGVATYGDPNAPAANGPLHAADASDAKGCALAIAYTDDVWSVRPEDFVVFSVQHECVWKRETKYEIPADLPPCPNGKCICSWNWMHGGQRNEGYANELYMVGFDCNVVNSKSDKTLAKPQLPVECRDDPAKCVKGAKQPLYWEGAQADGWNIANYEGMLPPTYNDEWGFGNGAQNDIFASSSSSKTSSRPAVKPAKAAAAVEVTRAEIPKNVLTVYETRTHIVTAAAQQTQRSKRADVPRIHKRRLDAGSLSHARRR